MVERFLSEPLVCGYVGPGDADVWRRLREACPVPVVATAHGPHHALAASGPGLLETIRPGAHTWGRYVVRRDRPRDRREAAHDLGLAGLWVDTEADEVVLHTDLLGIQDVFIRTVGNSTYFCNRIGPLRTLTSTRLSVDWDAWGGSLAFGGFSADSTGFAEIKRLTCGEVLRLHAGTTRRERDLPDWILDGDLCRTSPADTRDVADTLRSVLPRTRPWHRTAITVSGGWDARLIALGLTDRRHRRPVAWSVSPDNGFDDDLVLARELTAVLDLEHTIVQPHSNAWQRNRSEHLTRLEHVTWLHTWIAPLARQVRAAGRPVYDGLAGDVLLRNHVIGDVLDAASRGELETLLWERMGGSRFQLRHTLDEKAAEYWTESGRALLQESASVWSGHDAEATLRLMTVRTARSIGASPKRLFAPEVPVRLPLADPWFVRSALRVAPDRKRGNAFYRRLLSELDPVIGQMPSTNDGPPRVPAGGVRSQLNPAALTYLWRQIKNDPLVRGLLHPYAIAALRRREVGPVGLRLHVLHWASSLADWRRVNAPYLADTPLPF